MGHAHKIHKIVQIYSLLIIYTNSTQFFMFFSRIKTAFRLILHPQEDIDEAISQYITLIMLK